MLGNGNQKQMLSGLLYAIVGVFVAWINSGRPKGTLQDMGPGYWPWMISLFLMFIGAVSIIAGARAERAVIELPPLRPIFWIYAALFTFPVLLVPAGFILAIAGTVLVASFADAEVRWRHVLVLTLVLSAFCTLLFATLLGLNFSLLPVWLTY